MICTHLRLLTTILTSVLLYYADILTDIAVLGNYYTAQENGFFGISSFAIFSSLLAQILYSPLLSIYRNNQQQISTPSCIFRLLLSVFYCTPLYLLYKFLYLQCCRFAKGSRDELQLAKIEDLNEGLNRFGNDGVDEQQKQDPNMIDNSLPDSGILTEKTKYILLRNMVDDMIRYSFVKSCFQSSINIFVQVFVLGEFYLFSDETRKSTKDAIALSENDILLFPDDAHEIYLLMISTAISFVCLCNASWSQISDLVNTSAMAQVNWCIPILFRLRALLESCIRTLRFMVVSVAFGAIYGICLLLTETMWKCMILYMCDDDKQKRKRRLQKKRQNTSGYSGYSEMNDGDKRTSCECDCELYKRVASWMLFSRERFKSSPCLMRFTDIILWSTLLLAAACICIEAGRPRCGRLDGVCDGFLQFQNNCLPLEIIIAITILLVFLLIIYISSPSIFNLVSSLDQDIFGRKQKLLNGSQTNDAVVLRFDDEYESDEDGASITVIDISKPVQNPTMPKKPQRKYSNKVRNNLMLMSVDDELRDDAEQLA